MGLWVPVTLAAAAFQTVRFMLQKVLAAQTLSAAGATFSRFLYSLPFIWLLLAGYVGLRGGGMPQTDPGFWTFGLIGATSQILATVCVVSLFKERNFAVGITFKKTEVIQTALVGWIVLGEGVTPLGLLAIGLGAVALLLLSGGKGAGGIKLAHLRNRAAGLGIASGVLFAFSAVSYRAASLAVVSDDPLMRASVTLACVVAMQTAIMLIWLWFREPGQMRKVWQARRVAVWIGLTSMGGSLCWFIAFTLQNAAYVKALGQAELILSIAASTLFFREKITGREWVGMAVLVTSILLLVAVI